MIFCRLLFSIQTLETTTVFKLAVQYPLLFENHFFNSRIPTSGMVQMVNLCMHVRPNIIHSYIFNVKPGGSQQAQSSHELSVVTVESSKARPKSRIYIQRLTTLQHGGPTNQQHDHTTYECRGITYNYWKPSAMQERIVYCLSFHYILKTCISYQTCSSDQPRQIAYVRFQRSGYYLFSNSRTFSIGTSSKILSNVKKKSEPIPGNYMEKVIREKERERVMNTLNIK